MRNPFSKLTAVCLFFLVCLSTGAPALAAYGDVIAYVNRVLTTADDRWGGCMALLSVDPGTVLPACNWWVAFSCTGDFADPLQAYRMLDQTQLALATNKRVQVWFTDETMLNGFCFADRIDLLR